MSSGSRIAPGRLELVRSFVNTFDVETGQEALTTPADLQQWLEERGVAAERSFADADRERALGDDDLQRALAFREALRDMLLANNGQPLDAATLETMRTATGLGLLRIDIDSEGRAELAPAGRGVEDLIARLLAAVAEAQAEGTWERLKACPADDCRWAFYDHSRNRSRIWCSMEVCGNRAKTRTYRTRKSTGRG